MLYLGIGNAGSQILDHFRSQALQAGLDDTAWANSRLAVADADTNNSVIYRYGNSRGGEPSILEMKPGEGGVRRLPLEQFWSGGCGVYHIIGELLADEVDRRKGILDVLNRWVPDQARNGISIFLSAGGGTGGGAGPQIASLLASKWTTSARIYTVLPAVDQFACSPDEDPDARMNITCEDSFQCVSAGRLLVKHLHERAKGGGLAPDMFLVSSGYLAAPPEKVSYSRAVMRLDQFIARTVMVLRDSFNARGHLVTSALGVGNWVEPGEVRTQDPAKLGRRIVLSALQPLDLTRHEPTGMSALPLERNRYAADIGRFIRLDGEPENTSPPAEAVLMLRRTEKVHAWLYHNRETGRGEAGGPDSVGRLVEAVRRTLQITFHGVPVDFATIDNLSPKRLPPDAEFVLLLVLVSPLVDDVYRLVSYYIQSSFDWQEGGIDDVAQIIDDALVDNTLTRPNLLERLTREDAKPRLAAPGKEVYSPHFWGNYHHLKGKILQALRRPKEDIEARLLRPEHIVSALWYLREQLRIR